jgi:secretion/DNA translocation related TadE-like protein
MLTMLLMNLSVARNLAETAADQAALAGAGRAIAGESSACAIAEEVARAHQAELVSCQVRDLHVWVRVQRPLAPAIATWVNRLGVAPAVVEVSSHAEQPFLST